MLSFLNKTKMALGWTTEKLPLTSVTAPTTSTPGYLGEVRFDTAGNMWTYLGLDGANRVWSPCGFPAADTEYYDCYSGNLGKWVKKAKITLATFPNSTTKNWAHGKTATSITEVYIFMVVATTTITRQVPNSSQGTTAGQADTTNVTVVSSANLSTSSGWAYMKYVN